MTLIKSHTCATCGGELIINLDRQLYECPFCGVTFDFDFVRDETAFFCFNKKTKMPERIGV